MKQLIIDAHVHLSYLEKGQRSLIDVKKDLLKSMKRFDISRSIVIPDNVPNPHCADMGTLLEITTEEKSIIAMGTIYIFKNHTAQMRKLDTLLKSKKICAVKLFPGHDPFFPTDKRCESLYQLCMDHSVPVLIHTGANSGDMTCARFNDPKHIIKIAKKHPTLNIVLAHYFWPRMEYCHQMTVEYKNIFYDISAMADPEVLSASGGWAMSKKILEKTMSKKPHSVIFGTDWPTGLFTPDPIRSMLKERFR